MTTLPIKTPIRVQNPDGSFRDDFNYSFADPSDPTGQTPHPDFLGHIVLTGPLAGTITLKNGKTYDVTEKYMHCLPEEGGQVACIVHRMHNANNTPGFEPHVHSRKCGPEAGLEPWIPNVNDLGDPPPPSLADRIAAEAAAVAPETTPDS